MVCSQVVPVVLFPQKETFQKSFFLFNCKFFQGISTNHARSFVIFTLLHIQSPRPSSTTLLKKHLILYSPHIFPAATITSEPASPTSRLLHPLLYGSMSKSIHIGVLWHYDWYGILSESVKGFEWNMRTLESAPLVHILFGNKTWSYARATGSIIHHFLLESWGDQPACSTYKLCAWRYTWEWGIGRGSKSITDKRPLAAPTKVPLLADLQLFWTHFKWIKTAAW